MRSLFWKIFLWFWLAMTLVIAATVFVAYTVPSANGNAPLNARTRRWRFVANTSFAQWAQAQATAWERGTLLSKAKAPSEDIVSWLLDDGDTLHSASQENAEWWILTPTGTLLAHEKAGAPLLSKTLPNDVRRLARQAARANRVVASLPKSPIVASVEASTNSEFNAEVNADNALPNEAAISEATTAEATTAATSANDVTKSENLPANTANRDEAVRDEAVREELLASSTQTPRGQDVVFVARLTFPDTVRPAPRADATARRAFPLAFFFLRGEPLTRTLRLLTMLLTASLFCFWLARHVTRPVRQLRSTVRELSSGNLAARSDRRVSHRSDELGDLGRDFDAMAAQLETLMTAQRRLISDVSHELRSPLARLNIALELARRESNAQLANMQQSSTQLSDSSSLQASPPVPNTPTTNAFNRIEREATRLEELVGQLLMLSRLESGTPVENEETFDLVELVGQVVEDVRFEAQSQDRDIQFLQTVAQDQIRSAPVSKSKNGRVPGNALSSADRQKPDGQSERLELHGSRAFLRSGLENVIRNAIRFTPMGTVVQIELQREFLTPNTALRPTPNASPRAAPKTARQIVLRVLDDGPGVPEEALPKLFQPFYRVEDARDRQSGGTGLGLAIAERAVHLHRGTIRAFNRAEGGLCVEILLPPAQVSDANSLQSSTRLA